MQPRRWPSRHLLPKISRCPPRGGDRDAQNCLPRPSGSRSACRFEHQIQRERRPDGQRLGRHISWRQRPGRLGAQHRSRGGRPVRASARGRCRAGRASGLPTSSRWHRAARRMLTSRSRFSAGMRRRSLPDSFQGSVQPPHTATAAGEAIMTKGQRRTWFSKVVPSVFCQIFDGTRHWRGAPTRRRLSRSARGGRALLCPPGLSPRRRTRWQQPDQLQQPRRPRPAVGSSVRRDRTRNPASILGLEVRLESVLRLGRSGAAAHRRPATGTGSVSQRVSLASLALPSGE